jgi:hypothetical protein
VGESRTTQGAEFEGTPQLLFRFVESALFEPAFHKSGAVEQTFDEQAIDEGAGIQFTVSETDPIECLIGPSAVV